MSFLTLIEKGGLQKIATATVATFATGFSTISRPGDTHRRRPAPCSGKDQARRSPEGGPQPCRRRTSERTGNGKKGDPWRYWVPGKQNDEQQSDKVGTGPLEHSTDTREPHFDAADGPYRARSMPGGQLVVSHVQLE